MDNQIVPQKTEQSIDPLFGTEKIDRLYEAYFQSLAKIDDDDIYKHAGCKFCNHPARVAAEQKWEETESFVTVKKVFDEYQVAHPECTDELTISNVRRHILNHYQEQQKQIWLKEYSERVLHVMNKRIHDEHQLEILKRQMEMKLNEIAADPLGCHYKQADAMTKLGKMIIELMQAQTSLRSEVETGKLVTEKFTAIWFKVISAQKNPEIKQLLIDTLSKFQENITGITTIVDVPS